MKRITASLFMLLLLCGCATGPLLQATATATVTAAVTVTGTPMPTSTSVRTRKPTNSATAVIIPTITATPRPVMSSLAASLGITPDNIPFIASSTSTSSLVAAINEKLYAENGPDYVPSFKTVPSYRALIAGDVDLILVPEPSQAIKDEAAAAGVTLTYLPISYEALVFITHKDSGGKNITKKQVEDIYINNTTFTWAMLGGNNTPLLPLTRNVDSGSYGLLDNMILKGRPVHENVEAFMEGSMFSILESICEPDLMPEAGYNLGYSVYTYVLGEQANYMDIEENIKILSYEGVMPTAQSIRSGAYKLTTYYYAVIRSDQPANSPTRMLANWLTGAEGQMLMEPSGLLPVG